MDRYLHATIYEFNEATKGYWRNWERQVAWLSREIIFEMIAGNPYIPKDDKPKSKFDLSKLSTDPDKKEIEKQREKRRKPTKAELKHAEDILKGKLKK